MGDDLCIKGGKGAGHFRVAAVFNLFPVLVFEPPDPLRAGAQELVTGGLKLAQGQGHGQAPGLRYAPRWSTAPTPMSKTTRNSRPKTSQPSRLDSCGPGALLK